MPSIGGITCDRISGRVSPLKTTAEVRRRPGLDGYAIQQTGQGEAPVELVAHRYDTAAAVQTWLDSLAELQGTIVTLVDDWGDTYENVFVSLVDPRPKAPIIYNGAARAHGVCQMQGVLTQ